MKDEIRNLCYPNLVIKEGVQQEPLFWDYVGKPVWNVSEKNPLYTIDLSAGFSFRIDTITTTNYVHLMEAHIDGKYSKKWLFFKDKNDANKLINKVKVFIEENRYLKD